MSTSAHITACESAISFLTVVPSIFRMEPIDTLERLHELWEIDRDAYKDCSLDFESFKYWWQRYPLGSRVLLNQSDRIEGSIGIYPLHEDRYADFAAGRIKESDLSPVLADECDVFGSNTWYASGIVLKEESRGQWLPLRKLLQFGLGEWIDSGHLRYPCQICALAEYEIGAKLLEFFGFQKTANGDVLPDSCDLYALRIASHTQAIALLRTKIK